MIPRRRLHVDRIRCDGYGMCAELLPELIDLDDWGYPILRADVVPREFEGLARKAVEVCPVLALRLTAEPRRTPTPIARPAPASRSGS
ncbi:MAG TPA: ferredoxin [Candidatus Limnocylindrales bacterium]|nr:ferredoxin [Candidatus Limnocylindrales bacterium]